MNVTIVAAVITAVAAIVAAIICIYPHMKTETPNQLTRFQIEWPNAGDTLQFDSNGHTFRGKYTPLPAKGIDVYPIVQAPDKNLWPNPKAMLSSDGTWSATVYLGNRNNLKGEIFEVIFVSVPTKSKAANKIQTVVEKRGFQSLGQNLPENTEILEKRSIRIGT